MKQSFRDYLNGLSLSTIITERVLDRYSKLLIFISDNDFDDIFYSHDLLKDGSVNPLSIWAVKRKTLYKARILDQDIETYDLSKIYRLRINYSNYDFKMSNSNSRMHVLISYGGTEIQSNLIALGINCDKLLEFHKKHINANIVSSSVYQ